MEDKEQGLLVNYCKVLLPQFVKIWSDELQKTRKCVEALCNQTEQLYHVIRVIEMEGMDNFENVKAKLQYLISEGIEEQMTKLKLSLDVLNKANYDFKNKLSQLESNSLGLPEDCPVMWGNATQPALNNLLELSLDFFIYFSDTLKRMNDSYNNMDKSEEARHELEESFNSLNFENKRITYLLALTQYVGNER